MHGRTVSENGLNSPPMVAWCPSFEAMTHSGWIVSRLGRFSAAERTARIDKSAEGTKYAAPAR